MILREEVLRHNAPGGGSLAPAWQRRRFWHSPAQHALLHRAVVSAASGTVSAEGALDRAAVAFLLDHNVSDEDLLCLYGGILCVVVRSIC